MHVAISSSRSEVYIPLQILKKIISYDLPNLWKSQEFFYLFFFSYL